MPVGFVHTNLPTLYHLSTNNTTFLLFKKFYGYTLLSCNILPWKCHVVTERLISRVSEVEIRHLGWVFGLSLKDEARNSKNWSSVTSKKPADIVGHQYACWAPPLGGHAQLGGHHGVDPELTREIRNFIRPACLPGFSRRSWNILLCKRTSGIPCLVWRHCNPTLIKWKKMDGRKRGSSGNRWTFDRIWTFFF